MKSGLDGKEEDQGWFGRDLRLDWISKTLQTRFPAT